MIKSETDKLFDEVFKQYYDKFHKNYPRVITDTRPLQTHIEIMRKAIRDNKAVVFKPKPDVFY